MMFDTTHYVTLQPTLQPIKTISATRLNLRQSNSDNCKKAKGWKDCDAPRGVKMRG